MAKGSRSAQEKNRRPGKRHRLTSQAVPTPPISVSTPTPAISHNVLVIYLGRTVDARCAHKSPVGDEQMRQHRGVRQEDGAEDGRQPETPDSTRQPVRRHGRGSRRSIRCGSGRIGGHEAPSAVKRYRAPLALLQMICSRNVPQDRGPVSRYLPNRLLPPLPPFAPVRRPPRSGTPLWQAVCRAVRKP